jgi:predicted small lipoprotein YifL
MRRLHLLVLILALFSIIASCGKRGPLKPKNPEQVRSFQGSVKEKGPGLEKDGFPDKRCEERL